MAVEHLIHVVLTSVVMSSYLRALVACIASYICWRLWRFTIEPRLFPNEPKTYPYWIPLIGHSFSFFRDAEDTMYRARLYFNNKRDPFKLIIMGETIYVITSATDTVSVYKNESFTLNRWLKDLMGQFGASPSSVEAMWNPLPRTISEKQGHIDAEIGLVNWQDKPVKEVCVMLFRTMLNQDRFSEDLLHVLLDTVHTRMTWDQIPDWMVLGRQNGGDTCDVSLLKWSQHVLLEGATRSFFGDALLDIEPNLFESFYEFDESSWKLPYNIPNIFAKDVQRSKKTAEEALARYFALPKEKRKDASKLVQEIEAVLVGSGIQPNDMGILVLMFYWVINANAWKASFWMLTEILNNPTLRTTILDELSPFITPSKPCTLTPNDLATALSQSCPTLLAVYHESLRLTASSTSVRMVISTSRIRHFTLHKNGRIIIPYRQMMLDESVFGPDVYSFRHERFLDNPNLHKHPSYRPFGGGSSYCPGKALAMKEILTFVGLVVGKFGVELGEGEGEGRGVPLEMNTKTPCIGIMAPVGDGDVRVRIKRPAW